MENIFAISVEYVQYVAKVRTGRSFSIEELEEIQKGVEFGLELSWEEVLNTAIDDLLQKQENVATRHRFSSN